MDQPTPYGLPMPPLPLTAVAGPSKMVVPQGLGSYPGYEGARGEQPQSSSASSSKVYYPSQDPQRLGAKGDVVD